ncbi:immunodominant staphylococcal antigen IsaB family protein [Staphylococcus ratti]|uniref:Immunodominant staphylococcal antigen B n=1 Tax=Staphylococcus ratti TaxID=2892440 RepID=A0ABY3PD47_9STAP|nr:hypothetical protein [Staphylococcus ratti]UEX90205.1 hypothetical protein LN051_00575 [Staphylococcus ratti]
MKKLLKVSCATCIATAALFTYNVTSESHNPSVVHAATEEGYTIEGNTSDKGAFILEQKFIDAVKNNNLVINGYKITGNQDQETTMVDIYDQIIGKTGDNTASMVNFEVKKNTVSKDDIIKTFGQPVEEPYESQQGLDYKYKLGKNVIQIIVKDGYVTDFQINAHDA